MSQDTLPLVADAEVSPFDDAEGSRNKRALLVVGGVVGALVVAAGGFLLLGGGGESSDSALVVPHTTHQAPAPVKPAKKAVAKKLPATYHEQIGRDPFKALYVVPVAAPAGAAPAPSSAPAVIGGGDTSSSTPGTGTTPVVPAAKPYPVKLVSISSAPGSDARFSTWLVDGTKTTVLPAQRFGTNGELVVLAFGKNAKGAVTEAILQVGDDTPISVPIGQTNNVL